MQFASKILPTLHFAELNYISAMRRLNQIFWLAATLFIFFAGIWLGLKVTHLLKGNSGLHEESTVTVVEQIQTLSDLVTVKYVLERVEILEDAKWYGENRVLLLAHGIVKAGIDLRRLKPGDVEISGKKITIHLPPSQITDGYLDDSQTRVIDHTTGLLRSYDKDLEQTARQNAVDDIRRAARENGILKDADERAQLELALFLRQAGFERVEFTGINPSPLLNPTRESVP
ncbi:MAG TPA: DUF4230 domain-containing protein [Candidatus Dormibacteraeota bacterium]|nr:DUF4230 domain-containing protein [Candidatus Dormibacteraeota bacterium]